VIVFLKACCRIVAVMGFFCLFRFGFQVKRRQKMQCFRGLFKVFAVIGSLFLVALVPAFSQAAPVPLFGPEKFIRETGAPDSSSRTFAACNTGATYRLFVENGAAGKDRVSSATVSLNGVEIVRPSDLNQRVERVEKVVSLQGDNTLAVRLSSNPGGFLTVNLFCASGCLDVAITSPTPGSTVNRSRALVQGSLLNASGETGVVLIAAGAEGKAAELAQVQGNLFAGLVPLQVGENTLTTIGTDACGYQVRKEVIVHADSIRELIRLSALPASGILEGDSGIFETELEVEANLSAPIAQYAWDFDGDGTAEQSGANLSTVTAQYRQPGLYFPRLTITDAQGATFSETTVVNVMSVEEMDAIFKAKWNRMTKSLSAGEIEAAVSYFTDASQVRYRGLFTYLRDQLPEIAREMNNIQLVYLRDGRAKYRIRRMEEGQEITYYIYFHLLSDGLWKIHQF
jgi:hypothetical protein